MCRDLLLPLIEDHAHHALAWTATHLKYGTKIGEIGEVVLHYTIETALLITKSDIGGEILNLLDIYLACYAYEAHCMNAQNLHTKSR